MVFRKDHMPAPKSQITQVGKRKIELTNLAKILYPDDNLTKAHLIEYYFGMAPTILAHVKGRPLSLVRYPDGIDGTSFFQKNKPDWAPPWVEHVTLGEEKKDYIIATEDAVLVWLANLACIELHQMHSRAPHYDKPDYIAYDFDPPENFGFSRVVELALEFKEHLEGFGYYPFVKTTGRKGLHVITPIEPKWTFQQAFDAAKAVAQPFVDSHGSSMTLQLKKDRRDGKALLDIYRNRPSQTIVAAYSARGLPGAPVSTPLTWDDLPSISSSRELNLLTVPQRVKEHGDPWEGIAAYATAIHTERKSPPPKKKELAPARTRKTPAQLAQYAGKRSFAKTPEPPAILPTGSGHAFVVHRHHASRLHYDLRLERDGVLKSWAVPKGLPQRPGIKRLAVNVEDHPLDYVNFEGAIPKGEYGGGMMWKFAQGRYEITKEKKDGYYFRLNSRELTAEYRIYNTKDNQWLLERLDTPQTDWLQDRIEPMLAKPVERLPASDDYSFELKWDGLRALVSVDEGAVRIYGRKVLDFTALFPELIVPEQFRATNALFDGEIVCLDLDGRPNFRNVIHRMQQRGDTSIARAKAKHPAVCYLFDCLFLDGRAIVNEPLLRRREWLADAVKKGGAYRVSETVEDGAAFLEAAKQMGLEGVMAKRKDSAYQPGKRSDSWLKIKTHLTAECVIIGYTQGNGDRESTFGALHLAQERDGVLKYVGKVGAGFDDKEMGEIWKEIVVLTPVPRPVKDKPIDNAKSVWIEPRLLCEVRYSSLTPDGMLREPVFVRLRPDLSVNRTDV
jgi:DNA ligase D-like protein (predicted ligase)/DNA ligase D-like protein (predicted polymerase)/DNA ligase D-like protein (predicted 3'-phosphoesterase)